ncbi:YbjN domain-containing protein [Selenomonas sp. TAMA-11512]|uniref:YbjN domain-containing protein n=1 Tax=Selenomonas sp. TAMA-11512 TaxID=3095337 RepID=UPI0030D06DF6
MEIDALEALERVLMMEENGAEKTMEEAVESVGNAIEKSAKAKAFQAFLEEQEITAFTPEVIEDASNTVLFRSNIEAAGQLLPMAVIIDQSVFTIIRLELFHGFDMERKGEMAEYLNAMNTDYKMFKYYLREDGVIYIDLCMPYVDETFDPKMVQLMLSVLTQHLSATFKAFMAKVWEKK